MPLPIDPLLMLQLVIAVFIVATLPSRQQTTNTAEPSPADAETFRLDEGNTYTDPADMRIEQELQKLMAYRS